MNNEGRKYELESCIHQYSQSAQLLGARQRLENSMLVFDNYVNVNEAAKMLGFHGRQWNVCAGKVAFRPKRFIISG